MCFIDVVHFTTVILVLNDKSIVEIQNTYDIKFSFSF